jgi:hypothetical protein
MNKKMEVSMETFTIVDPRNEMVLFRLEHYWEAIGPLRANLADETVRWCISNKMAAFICLDEEFEKFGKPADPEAKDYFQEPPEGWPPANFEPIDTGEEQQAIQEWM